MSEFDVDRPLGRGDERQRIRLAYASWARRQAFYSPVFALADGYVVRAWTLGRIEREAADATITKSYTWARRERAELVDELLARVFLAEAENVGFENLLLELDGQRPDDTFSREPEG